MNGTHSRNLVTGYVEVCAKGSWMPVCDAGWDKREAMVVCRQEGFSEGEHVNHA